MQTQAKVDNSYLNDINAIKTLYDCVLRNLK